MNLQILYDNKARNGFEAGWGFSCFIESDEHKIIFDTGWNGYILLHNMKIANIDPAEIDKIIISHSHWDHIGGLNHILKYARKPDIYIPKSVSSNLRNEIKRDENLIEISKPQKICENVCTSGELGDKLKEQSLILETRKGIVVVTGCAHPGLKCVIKKSREFGSIYAVIGGFHDSQIDILVKIPVIVPCHCTRKKDEIKKTFPASSYCETGLKFSFY